MAREDTRGRGAGYCMVCLPHPPAEPVLGPVPTAVSVDTREILTTEAAFVARDDVLVEYLVAHRTGRFIRPVVLMQTFWLLDVLDAEAVRRGDSHRRFGLARASERIANVRFCLLEGNHRSLAASLLDRPVTAVVIETPAHLDEWRRRDPCFPHVEHDLLALGRKWLDAWCGSVEQAAFDTDPLTVFERAELVLNGAALPQDAMKFLRGVRGALH